MSCAGLWVTPSTARNPMEKRLPVDNSVCGSCLGALGPWLTSVFRLQWIICDEIVSTVKAVAGEFSQCSPALLHQVHLWAGWCLLYWILREKKIKNRRVYCGHDDFKVFRWRQDVISASPGEY